MIQTEAVREKVIQRLDPGPELEMAETFILENPENMRDILEMLEQDAEELKMMDEEKVRHETMEKEEKKMETKEQREVKNEETDENEMDKMESLNVVFELSPMEYQVNFTFRLS